MKETSKVVPQMTTANMAGTIKSYTSFFVETSLEELITVNHILEVEIARCNKLRDAKRRKGDNFLLSFSVHMQSFREKLEKIRSSL